MHPILRLAKGELEEDDEEYSPGKILFVYISENSLFCRSRKVAEKIVEFCPKKGKIRGVGI